MGTKSFPVLRGRRLRVTKLDSCGRAPVASTPDVVAITKGFISVSMSSETEDGTETIQRNASGEICINEQDPGQLKRITVEAEFCGVDPAVLTLMSAAEQYEGYGDDVIGIVEGSVPLDGNFALELWLGIPGGSCDVAGDSSRPYGYVLLPFVSEGIIGDITVNGTDAINFTVTGMFTKDGTSWGVGPYAVLHDADGVPAALPSPLTATDHRLLIQTTVAPPEPVEGLVAMPQLPASGD